MLQIDRSPKSFTAVNGTARIVLVDGHVSHKGVLTSPDGGKFYIMICNGNTSSPNGDFRNARIKNHYDRTETLMGRTGTRIIYKGVVYKQDEQSLDPATLDIVPLPPDYKPMALYCLADEPDVLLYMTYDGHSGRWQMKPTVDLGPGDNMQRISDLEVDPEFNAPTPHDKRYHNPSGDCLLRLNAGDPDEERSTWNGRTLIRLDTDDYYIYMTPERTAIHKK